MDEAVAKWRLRDDAPPFSAAKERNGQRQSRPKADQKLSKSMSLRRSVPSRSTTRSLQEFSDTWRTIFCYFWFRCSATIWIRINFRYVGDYSGLLRHHQFLWSLDRLGLPQTPATANETGGHASLCRTHSQVSRNPARNSVVGVQSNTSRARVISSTE